MPLSLVFGARLLPIILAAFFLGACGNGPKSAVQPAPESALPENSEPARAGGESSGPEYRGKVEAGAAQSQAAEARNAASAEIAPCWLPLRRKLLRDGLPQAETDKFLSELAPTPTQAPMGRKMLELYRRDFLPKSPRTERLRYYKGVVTQANAALCREFIVAHKGAFEAAQKRYGVPPSIAAALLFVETRLGKVLGDVPENAFYTLASMAVSTKPEDISSWLAKMPGYREHLAWMDETMRKRADWAYNETRALLEHIIRDKVPPEHLPGSIYGAVGLCQFMPSNITPYGADGDGDGRVDLFTAPDAVASLSNYLYRHGWRAGQSREKQHKLLMTYNHSQVYANTILALADLVAGRPGSAE